MTGEEAAKLGVDPDDHWRHVRLDGAKENLAPPPEGATWFRLASVALPSGESVQAIERWHPPSALADLSTANEVAILERIERGPGGGERYSADRRAADRWVGHAVLAAFGDNGFVKTPADASRIVKAWIEAGVLRNGEYHSEAQRKTRSCCTVDSAKLAQMRKDAERI